VIARQFINIWVVETEKPPKKGDRMTVQTETTQCINGTLQPGDIVISNADTEYAYLVGVVSNICKLGSSDHYNYYGTDDVHVNFLSQNYSNERINEIAQCFSRAYRSEVTFNELSLDNVAMPPDSLLRITGMEPQEIGNMYQSKVFVKNYFDYVTLSGHDNSGYDDLEKRLNQNLADFDSKMMGLSKRELIENASEIASMHDTHYYLTSLYSFEKEEIAYLLLFQNPLEIISDSWLEHQDDLSRIPSLPSVISQTIKDNNAIESGYTLMLESESDDTPGRQRFMNVDILDFLGKIAEKVIIYYPRDWDIDKDILRDYAISENPEDKRLVWHVCSFGTHIKPEREVFIADSGAFSCMTDYRQNEPDMFGYVIEITRASQGTIWGNVFTVGDYAEYAKHIRENALPLNSVSLTYSGVWGINAGKTVTVSRREYDSDRHRLMSDSGNVTSFRWHPANELELTELLRQERFKRMACQVGDMTAHLDNLSVKLGEIRGVPEITKELPTHTEDKKMQAPCKTDVKVKISIEDRLSAAKEKVNAQAPRKAPGSKRDTPSID